MSAPSESSVFQALFQAACKEYAGRTGTNLDQHPLALQLQTCDSFGSLISLLQDQAQAFDESRDGDKVMISLSHICVCLCDVSVGHWRDSEWGLRRTPRTRESDRVDHQFPSAARHLYQNTSSGGYDRNSRENIG